jgi:iron complex transport system ATP-binding protein
MISARNLSFKRGHRFIFDEVSFDVVPGELVAIFGPNGAGKSSLLQVMAGALKPASGEIIFAGRPLQCWGMRDLAMRRAVLSQSTHVAFQFTVEETLLLSVPDGFGRSRLPAIAKDMLAQVGLSGFGPRILQELSGGEQQRVHLARVLTQLEATRGNEPQALFLDEPVSGLDLRHQIETMQLARKLSGEQLAVVAVIHDLNLVQAHATRFLCVHDGKLAADGTPKTCLTPTLIKKIFQVETKIQSGGALAFSPISKV